MGFLNRLFGQGRLVTIDVPECDSDIFGDQYFQDTLASIAGPKRKKGYHKPVSIELRRDPDTPSDKNTVICLIDGRQVGEIKHKDAPKLQGSLRQTGKSGQRVVVDGYIVGGTEEDFYRVLLNIAGAEEEYEKDHKDYVPAGGPTVYLKGSRNIPLAGVNHYADAARRIVARNPEVDIRVHFLATLVPEPDNPDDPNAIAVYGEGQKIGCFSQEHAAKYRSALAKLASSGAIMTAPGTVYAGHHGGAGWSIGVKLPTPKQLEARTFADGTVEEVVELPQRSATSSLGPESNVSTGESRALVDGRRMGLYAGKHYSKYVEQVKQLKRDGDLDAAAELLQHLIVAVEREAGARDWVPAPWYYDQLAVVYRKQKRYDDEVVLLEHFLALPKARDSTTGQALPDRLEKVRALQARAQEEASTGDKK